MRVLLAAGVFPPELGGPATYAKIISEELRKRGTSVDVLPFRDARRFPKIIRHIAYVTMLAKRARGTDVIFAQDPVSVGLPALIISKLYGTKFVLRVAGDYAWEQGVQRFHVAENLDQFAGHTRPLFSPVGILQRIQSRVARSAACVVVPSRYFAGIVEKWGVPRERIVVVYSAFVSHMAIAENEEELRVRLDLSYPSILSAGRLVPWKGMSTLVEIMPELVRDNKDATLIIAGDGPEREKLKELVREKHLERRVRFLGALPQETLFEYVKASDIFVLNTGYEGLSYQLLEVMAIGTPIITTNVGGNPELIESGREGVLVSYNNKTELLVAIKEVLSDSARTQVRIAAAKRKVIEFSTQRMVEGTIKVLKAL